MLAVFRSLLPVNPQRPAISAADVTAGEVSRLQNTTSLPLAHSTTPAPAPLSLPSDPSSFSSRPRARFPGSISIFQPAPQDIRRALELRRSVAAETLANALSGAKLSINYANRIVSVVPAFVDRIVVEAAELKGEDEFAHLSFNARAKTFILSSGIVPLVKWLKHHSLSYPQIGKVVCMCADDLEPVGRTVGWLKSVHVKGEYLGRVLLKGASALRRDVDELDDIVCYLERSGVRRDWMGFVISRCPQILNLSIEDLRERVRFYTDMGIRENDFGTMVFDCPRALGSLSLDEMNSKVSYLKEFGLSTQEVGSVLSFKPQLMLCSIEEKWKSLVKYLHYLNVSRDGMKRMLVIEPVIFCLDLEATIAPKVRFLQDIGVRDDTIGSVLVKFPPILTCSLYKKIRPVVIFLLTKAGVKKRDVGKVIAMDPQIVSCSIVHKLEINLKYFLSLGIHPQLVGEMIADFPMLLRYKQDALRPKYQYLRRVMARPLRDLIEFPRFFSYSLEGRIIPRHKLMVANRVNFKLRYMLAGNDEDFHRRVDEAVERRRRFEAGETISNISEPGTPETSLEDSERTAMESS